MKPIIDLNTLYIGALSEALQVSGLAVALQALEAAPGVQKGRLLAMPEGTTVPQWIVQFELVPEGVRISMADADGNCTMARHSPITRGIDWICGEISKTVRSRAIPCAA